MAMMTDFSAQSSGNGVAVAQQVVQRLLLRRRRRRGRSRRQQLSLLKRSCEGLLLPLLQGDLSAQNGLHSPPFVALCLNRGASALRPPPAPHHLSPSSAPAALVPGQNPCGIFLLLVSQRLAPAAACAGAVYLTRNACRRTRLTKKCKGNCRRNSPDDITIPGVESERNGGAEERSFKLRRQSTGTLGDAK